MRGQLLKTFLSLMITVLLVSLLTTFIWYTLDNNNVQPQRSHPQKKSAPQSSASCKDCRENINKVLELYSGAWKKQEASYQTFRGCLTTDQEGEQNRNKD
ncbi:hypothetical protein ILYODFUR_017429 [Ilyodon furcidens]|uniref:Uncharacterized protein n=1 Tax=Ilyodon furcidens TaxID=33524 RepID=A0ABV0SY42_9TELE